MAATGEDPSSHEVDRHRENQPPREDLLDPDEIEIGERDPFEEVDDEPRLGDPELLPDEDDLPESQGADVAEAARLVEDHAERPALSDEEVRGEEE